MYQTLQRAVKAAEALTLLISVSYEYLELRLQEEDSLDALALLEALAEPASLGALDAEEVLEVEP